MQWAYEQMKQLDAWATSLMTQANTPLGISPSGDSEFDTAESIRDISRIKISR